MMKKLLIICILGVLPFNGLAQFEFDPSEMIKNLIGTIESDRPGQAMSAKTCGTLAIQLQTGFNYETFNNDKISKYQHYYVPTTVRFGLTKFWELNTSFNYLNSHYFDTLVDQRNSGFTSPEVGIRFAFLAGDRWVPYMALQSNLSILSHHGDFQQQQYGSSFYLITSNRFEVVSVNTNLGIRFTGDGNTTPQFPWVLNLGFALSNKWSAFAEGYGDFRSRSLNFDAGVAFTPVNSLQLDVYGGWLGAFGERSHYFIEGGISYRYSFLKRIMEKKATEYMKQPTD